MLPWLQHGGNPSSLHAEGRRAKAAIDLARERIAARMGCEFAEVVFTSGGTEACNLALIGRALANKDPSRTRVLISAAEHACVWGVAPLLRRLGYRVEAIPVDLYARPILEHVEPDVLLVAAMAANNELGTITDVAPLAALCRAAGVTLFCDAVQMPGPTDADLVAIAGHKMGGPRGVGALIVRAGTRLKPFVAGGAQERERRGGTEDTAAIVGFGAACTLPAIDPAPARDAFFSRIAEWSVGDPRSEIRDPAILPSHAHVRFPRRRGGDAPARARPRGGSPPARARPAPAGLRSLPTFSSPAAGRLGRRRRPSASASAGRAPSRRRARRPNV